MDFLSQPLSIPQMMEMTQKDQRVHGNVAVYLMDIVNNDAEGFLDMLSESLTGNCLLMDITHELVGTNGPYCIIHVTGDASAILNDFPYNLDQGDEVTWNDPDDGLCTRTGVIQSIVWKDSEVAELTLQDGWCSEVRGEELA